MLTDAPHEASRTPDSQGHPSVEAREEGGVLVCAFSGNWTTRRVHFVDSDMRALETRGNVHSVVVDVSGLHRIDTTGAWLIVRLIAAMRARGIETSVFGESKAASILLNAVGEATRNKEMPPPPTRQNIIYRFLES